MGELKDRAKGLANETIGKAKQATADGPNDPQRDDGAAQELKGKAQQVVGKVKGAFGDKV